MSTKAQVGAMSTQDHPENKPAKTPSGTHETILPGQNVPPPDPEPSPSKP